MPQLPAPTPNAAGAIATAAGFPDGAQVEVMLFSGDLPNFEARRLNPTTSLADSFRSIAGRFANEVAGRTPVAYSPGRVPADYEVAWVSAGEVAGLTELLTSVEHPIDLELFEPDSAQARRLRFYVVAIQTPNPGWIHFLRSKGPTLRLRRTRKIAAVMRGATYDELAEDPLLFDDRFDAIVADGTALIINQGAFQRALGFVEQARALAAQTITEIAQQLAIANFDEFNTAATSDINMVTKLRSIAAKIAANPAYAAAMTTERIIAFAEAHQILIDTEEVDGQRRLVFHPEPARRWRILKLLDDDYLHSQLTEFDYEVNSKSPLAP
jgi:hypothetical protein